MTTKAAFIGLGVMGYPMAGHLARAGLEVRTWNRTAAKARSWADEYPEAKPKQPKQQFRLNNQSRAAEEDQCQAKTCHSYGHHSTAPNTHHYS